MYCHLEYSLKHRSRWYAVQNPVQKDLIQKIKEYPKTTKFVIFNSNSMKTAEFFDLIFDGYHIDFKLWETIDLDKLEEYDVIIDAVTGPNSNSAYRYKDNVKNYFIRDAGGVEYLTKDVQCVYMSSTAILTDSEGRPVEALCRVTPEYLYQKKYRIVDKIVFLGKLRFLFLTNKTVEK